MIGNLNNNNFALLRYLLDLGLDVELILMKNDVSKSQTHFLTSNDTWEQKKWNRYIKYIDLYDWQIFFLKSISFIKKTFSNYNFFICSGMIPIILSKASIKVDIFYNYTEGIEFIGGDEGDNNYKNKSFLKRILYLYIRKKQIKALKKTKQCISPDVIRTKRTYDRLNIKMKVLSIPMLYSYKIPKEVHPKKYIIQLLKVKGIRR